MTMNSKMHTSQKKHYFREVPERGCPKQAKAGNSMAEKEQRDKGE
jgi:hypothetical protein